MTSEYQKLKKPLIAKLYTKAMAPATKLYYTNSVFRDRVNHLRRTKPHLNRYQTLWISMLQHGIYPYADGTLENSAGGRCCLGVACALIPDPYTDLYYEAIKGKCLSWNQPKRLFIRLRLTTPIEYGLMFINDIRTSNKYPRNKRHRYIAAMLLKPEFWKSESEREVKQLARATDLTFAANYDN